MYEDLITEIPDFPIEGVNFKDISPLLGNRKVFNKALDDMFCLVEDVPDYWVGIDARGKFNYANVQVEIDENLLTQISEMTGGKYFRATDNETLKEIYSDIDELEKTEIEEFKYYSVDEKFRYFLLPAIILIAFEMIMKLTILRSFI